MFLNALEIREEIIKRENNPEKKESLNNEKSPVLTRRKSKNEPEGRTYLCELCNKAYLSYPALYTHKKLKHENTNIRGRGRGRPKKDQNED